MAVTTKFRNLKNGKLSGYRRQWVRDAQNTRRQICSPSFTGRDKKSVDKQLDTWAVHGWAKSVNEAYPFKSVATQSVGEYIENWLPTAQWSDYTRGPCESVINNHIRNSVIWDLPLQTLKLANIIKLLNTIQAPNKTKRTALKLLKTAFNKAVALEEMPSNPVNLLSRTDKPKVTESAIVPLTIEDEALLVNYLSICTTFWRAAILLGLDGGLGPAEIGGLRLYDITVRKGHTFVRVERNLTNGQIVPPKADSRARTLLVSAETAQALRDLTASLTGRETHIFKNDGPLMKYPLFLKEFHAVIKAAGIENRYAPYSLRHTMATRNLNAGMKLGAVSKRLGHKSITTTVKHYIHADDREADAGAEYTSLRFEEIRAAKGIKFAEATASLDQAVGE